MIRRPPRSTLDRSSAASDVYKRQKRFVIGVAARRDADPVSGAANRNRVEMVEYAVLALSLIHISEPTRPY